VGIGLNTARTITEAVGGKISLKSKVNLGTSVFVKIPLHSKEINICQKKLLNQLEEVSQNHESMRAIISRGSNIESSLLAYEKARQNEREKLQELILKSSQRNGSIAENE